jgi:hypothetical protein
MRIGKTKHAVLLAIAVLAVAGVAHANTITICTPAGSSDSDGNVSACATITTGNGTVTVQLSNLQNPIQAIGQSLTDIEFTLSSNLSGSPTFSGNASGGSLLNCTSGTCVAGDTSPPSGLAASNQWGWGVSLSGNQLTLVAGGGSLKPGGIVNSSIDASKRGIRNRKRNPWVVGPVTFTINARA